MTQINKLVLKLDKKGTIDDRSLKYGICTIKRKKTVTLIKSEVS